MIFSKILFCSLSQTLFISSVFLPFLSEHNTPTKKTLNMKQHPSLFIHNFFIRVPGAKYLLLVLFYSTSLIENNRELIFLIESRFSCIYVGLFYVKLMGNS